MRRGFGAADQPLGVVQAQGQMQVLSSLNAAAEAEGLSVGQPLRDAQAICSGLLTRLRNPQAEAAFLGVLRRWAGQFSPWVAEEAPAALLLDISGCAHLFGGEAGLLEAAEAGAADLGLTLRAGIADTVGAAWALARYAGRAAASHRSGDAVEQEARATRSRAVKRRHWERGGAAPSRVSTASVAERIAGHGKAHAALAPLPVAALRLEPALVEELARLGLRLVGDLAGQPRAALGRRFGKGLVLRLDQALGSAAEPLSPAPPPRAFAVRLTLPEPIGLAEDLSAALDRLLPRLCDHLKSAGLGARLVRLEAHRADGTRQGIEAGLARPAADPDRLRPLVAMKLPEIEAGFGIDMIRLEAIRTEPLHDRQSTGHLAAGQAVSERLAKSTAMDDLVTRVGARIGLEAVTRRHPGESHLPEKSAQVLGAAWSDPAGHWPRPGVPRPLVLWRPEPVQAPERPDIPDRFRWRGQDKEVTRAEGPERITREWWLDDPDWRTGTRDYWRVSCRDGDRLWLYYGHGAEMSAGWFCHGSFC